MERTVPEIQLHETPPEFPYRLITVKKANRLNYWHAETEFVKVLADEMTIRVNAVEYNLKKGDILFIPGGDIHRVETPESCHIVMQFDIAMFDRQRLNFPFLNNLRNKLEHLERSSQNWPYEVKNAVVSIINQLEETEQPHYNDRTGYILKIQSLLYQLMNILWKDIPKRMAEIESNKPSYDKKMLQKLENVLEYVKTNYGTNITLDTISHVSNYSVNHFTKIWYRYMGTHFHTYLNDYRINEATILLRDSNLSITELSAYCGFCSYKTFIRVFKNTTGMSAQEYRKIHSKTKAAYHK